MKVVYTLKSNTNIRNCNICQWNLSFFFQKMERGKKLIRLKCITFSVKTLAAQVIVTPNQNGLNNKENVCHLIWSPEMAAAPHCPCSLTLPRPSTQLQPEASYPHGWCQLLEAKTAPRSTQRKKRPWLPSHWSIEDACDWLGPGMFNPGCLSESLGGFKTKYKTKQGDTCRP